MMKSLSLSQMMMKMKKLLSPNLPRALAHVQLPVLALAGKDFPFLFLLPISPASSSHSLQLPGFSSCFYLPSSSSLLYFSSLLDSSNLPHSQYLFLLYSLSFQKTLVLDVDPARAVSEGHLEELLPLAKMMMVEEVSKQLGADAPPEVVAQVEADMSPHHLRPPAVWPMTSHSHLPEMVSQAVCPPYWVCSLSIS